MKTIDFDFFLKKVDGTITELHAGRELAGILSTKTESKNPLKIWELAKKLHLNSKVTLDTSDFEFLKEEFNSMPGLAIFFKAQIQEAIANAKAVEEKKK
jgi:hypothetical protein